MLHFLDLRKIIRNGEAHANIFNKLSRTYTNQMDTLLRWRSGPGAKAHRETLFQWATVVRLFVGHLTQNAVDKDKAAITNSPRLVTDQSGTTMPIIQPDERSVTPVPRIEQGQGPFSKGHKARAAQMTGVHNRNVLPMLSSGGAVIETAPADPVGRLPLMESSVVACTVARRDPARHWK